MSKLFSHAGVSRLHGKLKVRWANGAERVKVLVKGGHTDIDLVEIREPMTKEDAVLYLIGIDFDNGNAEVRACLEAEAVKRGVMALPAAAAAEEEVNANEDAAASSEEDLTDTADNVIDISEEVAAPLRADDTCPAFAAWAAAADAEEAAEAEESEEVAAA